MAYYEQEPWGAIRDNWHSAGSAAAIVSALGGKLKPEALMYRPQIRYASAEDVSREMAKAVAAMAMFGGGNG